MSKNFKKLYFRLYLRSQVSFCALQKTSNFAFRFSIWTEIPAKKWKNTQKVGPEIDAMRRKTIPVFATYGDTVVASEPLMRPVKTHKFHKPPQHRRNKILAFFVFAKTPFFAFRFVVWPQNAARARFVAPPKPLLYPRPRPLLAPKKWLPLRVFMFCKKLI